jgi:hypothetical protein
LAEARSGEGSGSEPNRQISIYANFTGYFSGTGNSVGGFGGVKVSW